MGDLVHYERARQEIAECARIDEAAEFRDKAAAVAAYARQRNDVELEVWFSEIRLRASIRIGELVGDLDTANAGRPNSSGRPDELTKTDAIKAAGLTRTDAYNCQQLAGGKKEAVASVAHKAAEAHFLQAREEKRPAMVQSLRNPLASPSAAAALTGTCHLYSRERALLGPIEPVARAAGVRLRRLGLA